MANVSIDGLVERRDSDVDERMRTLELVVLTFDIRQARTASDGTQRRRLLTSQLTKARRTPNLQLL